MNTFTLTEADSKKCGKCKKVLPNEQFWRRNNVWKSCNSCSARETAKRRNETLAAEHAHQQQLAQQIAGFVILDLQKQYQMRKEQADFEQQQQRLFEQRESAPQTGMEYLLANDTKNIELSPVERYELQLRKERHAWGIVSPKYVPQPDEWQGGFSDPPRNEANTGMVDHDAEQGMSQNYAPLTLNSSIDDRLAGVPQLSTDKDYNWAAPDALIDEYMRDEYSPQGGDFDRNYINWDDPNLYNQPEVDITHGTYDDSVFQGIQAEVCEVYRSPSQGDEMDIEMDNADSNDMVGDTPADNTLPDHLQKHYLLEPAEQFTVPPEAPTTFSPVAPSTVSPAASAPATVKRTKKASKQKQKPAPEPAPVNLSVYFDSFDPNQDLLNQPDPEHDLAGPALAAHLIAELGLAHRLKQLRARWSKFSYKKQKENFYTEVNTLLRLDAKGECTPWGPLSDWLVEFELSLEQFESEHTYPGGHVMNWIQDRKRCAAKFTLAKHSKRTLLWKVEELEEQLEPALVGVFMELTGESKEAVKEALEKELVAIRREVERDCSTNGYLFLKVGRKGTYVGD